MLKITTFLHIFLFPSFCYFFICTLPPRVSSCLDKKLWSYVITHFSCLVRSLVLVYFGFSASWWPLSTALGSVCISYLILKWKALTTQMHSIRFRNSISFICLEITRNAHEIACCMKLALIPTRSLTWSSQAYSCEHKNPAHLVFIPSVCDGQPIEAKSTEMCPIWVEGQTSCFTSGILHRLIIFSVHVHT